MQLYEENITDPLGNALASSSYTVYTDAARTTKATLYQSDGVTSQSNPVTSDALGYVSFRAADGKYYVTVSGTGITSQNREIVVFDPSASTGSAGVGFVQSGSGAVTESVQDDLRQRAILPEQFGCVGDGTTDDYTNLLKAFVAAVAQSKPVDLRGKTYLVGTAIALDSTYSGLKIQGYGGTIKKGFNGNLLTLTNTANFDARGVTFEGQHGTYTGKGVVFSGSSSNYPVFIGCLFSQFTDTDLEFGADSGHSAAVIGCRSRLGTGQTDPRSVHINGPDTGARIRRFVGCSFEGYLQFDGAQDAYVSASQFTRIVPNSACDPIFVSSCRWGNGNSAMTLSGNCHITGCSFAGAITLDANYKGSFVANTQSTGTFTDSTTSGNAIILHIAPSGTFYNVGRHQLDIQATTAFQIQTRALISPGDADLTFTPGSSGPDIVYATSLTANRTVTLSTTGAKNGSTATISRPAGDTGGPWTVAVGATGTTLATKTWCEVIYTGSFWRVLKYGTLP